MPSRNVQRPPRWQYDPLSNPAVLASLPSVSDSTSVPNLPISPPLSPASPIPPISPKAISAYATSNYGLPDDEEDNNINDHDIDPTQTDLLSLPRVPAPLPYTAFIIALVELCERFAFYGLSGPFQNYISNSPNGADGNPGALGLGQSWATALTSAFSCWCYVTSVAGAIVADQYVGKYRAIVSFSVIYLFGLVILVASATDASIKSGWALWGLLSSMAVIGLGTGGIKANVAPLIAEQVTDEGVRIIRRRGKRVLVDPKLTIQRIYMVFYLCINVGSLSGIITTYMEHHTGFWSAYLLALCFFVLGIVVLIFGRKKYIVKKPRGSVVADSMKVMYLSWTAGKKGLDIAKPSIRATLALGPVPWDDAFVEDVKKALGACKVLFFFPLYYMAFFQMMNNFVSQAGTMELHGIPNDLMSNIDPIAIIIFIPLLDRFIYPFLRRHNLPLRPTTRITLGFILASISMFYAAYIQHIIYLAPPCYNAPLNCAAAQLPNGKVAHNKVHVAWQTPTYILIGLSEILAGVTGLEFAYNQAPSSMKSLVQSVFLLMSAAGAMISAAISPWARDPYLTSMYSVLGVLAGLSGLGFWNVYGKWDDGRDIASGGIKREEEVVLMGRLDRRDQSYET